MNSVFVSTADLAITKTLYLYIKIDIKVSSEYKYYECLKKNPVCFLLIGLNLFFLEWLYLNGYWFNLYTKLLTDSESSEFMDYPSLVADSDSYTSNARGD